MLERDVRWVDAYRAGRPPDLTSAGAPRLLAPLAGMLGERRDRFALSPAALRSLLDGLASRLEESREIARYFTGLMIFLGLLGTFWGLSATVGSIGDVIRNLTISSDDVQSAFSGLKQGLDAPLAGMGDGLFHFADRSVRFLDPGLPRPSGGTSPERLLQRA